ncbi:MAG: MBL fold metallo-hydrolase RNA specificity domain-containing protein, partial [Candidatus Bathyarchaeia archaeon]
WKHLHRWVYLGALLALVHLSKPSISGMCRSIRNAIFLVGYQIPGTPGRELMEKGRCVIDGKVRKIKARVGFFDFSSHCGASELKETIRGLRGKPIVFTIHGAEGNCQKFAKWIKDEVGLEAKAPNPGETFTI